MISFTALRLLLGLMLGTLASLALGIMALVKWKMREAILTGVAIPHNPASLGPLRPYLAVFPVAGLVVSGLWPLRPRPLRITFIGAVLAGTTAVYLFGSAPYRNPFLPRVGTISTHAVIGAGLGATAGLILGLLDWLRDRRTRAT